MPDNTQPKRLYLSSTDKRLSGLCGGIAEYFNVDASVIRLLWILITILTGIIPGVVAYIVGAVIVPHEPVSPSNTVA